MIHVDYSFAENYNNKHRKAILPTHETGHVFNFTPGIIQEYLFLLCKNTYFVNVYFPQLPTWHNLSAFSNYANSKNLSSRESFMNTAFEETFGIFILSENLLWINCTWWLITICTPLSAFMQLTFLRPSLYFWHKQ